MYITLNAVYCMEIENGILSANGKMAGECETTEKRYPN